MAFKSDFQGRTIDEQIDYVKNKLPGIIENFTNELSKINKDKAEASSVPQKTSQIENDSGYITGKTLEEALSVTTEDIINTLRTEHIEHLCGSDIDTKYKVGEYIPSLMIYESGYDIDIEGNYITELYKNAPFEWDGFILTHSCLYDNGNGTTSPFTYQFGISSNGKFVYRVVSDEEFADVPWSGNLVVGEKTDEGGEIFNDYDNNRAISKYSSAKNKNNLSGAMAFTILGVDENTKTYTLDSVKGLAVGDVYSIHTHYENSDGLEISRQRMDYGAITSIDNTTNTVTVDNIFVLAQKDLDAGYVFAPLSEERWYTDGLDNEENTFRIITKPMIGTRKIGYATSTSGYDNQAHSKGASSRGRDNISYGSYADTSGKNNKAGYCAFSTGIENHSKAETAFTANKGNVVTANQGAAFGSSNEVNGTNGFGVGNKNKIGKNSTSSFVGGEGNFVANNGTSQQSFTFGKGHYNNADQSAIFGLRNKATKSAAFVVNSDNEANAVNTAVFGQGNTATTAGQMVRGRFSEPSSDYIDIVGYGEDKNNKKNIYTLSKKGVGWFAKGLKIGGAKQSEGIDVATIDTLYGDEIDNKWNYNPESPMMMYHMSNGYDHSPFEECFILNKAYPCPDSEDSFYNMQIAISKDGKIKYRYANDGALDAVDWYENETETNEAIENAKDTAMKYADSITKDFILGSEIDEKYNADSVIPQILTYGSSGYDNAPFSTNGIIITSMPDETGEDEYGSYKVCPQWAISGWGELKYRMVIYGEINYRVPWSENLIPTKVGELENDKEYTTKKDVEDVIKETKAEANEIYANALKGFASGNVISLNDVSPVPHTVKTSVHSKNIFNINDVYRTIYTDYRVEDNKLIFTKTNTTANQFSNIFFNLGTCNEFRNKTLTVSITNEFSKALSTHLVQRIGDTLYTSEPLVKMGIVKANDTTTFTVTVPDKDIEGVLCLRIVAPDTTVNDDEYTLSNIQVEYGTQATEYKPYVNIEDTTITSCGTNLFDVHSATKTSSNNTCTVEAPESGVIRTTIKLKGSPQYGASSIFLPLTTAGTLYFKAKARCSNAELTKPEVHLRVFNSDSGGYTTKKVFTSISTERSDLSYKMDIAASELEEYDKFMLLIYVKNSSVALENVGEYVELEDIMLSTSDIEYEPYISENYIPNKDGTVEINSIYPVMNITTDTPNVVINAEYNRDINKAFAELQALILEN